MEMKKAEDCETVEEVQAYLKVLDEDNRLIQTPEELERIENEILSYTNRLAALLLKKNFRPH
ncbi:hypothetical protein [Desulfobacter latus]|nr:hypothetical protein [Desulfobacter latus]